MVSIVEGLWTPCVVWINSNSQSTRFGIHSPKWHRSCKKSTRKQQLLLKNVVGDVITHEVNRPSPHKILVSLGARRLIVGVITSSLCLPFTSLLPLVRLQVMIVISLLPVDEKVDSKYKKFGIRSCHPKVVISRFLSQGIGRAESAEGLVIPGAEKEDPNHTRTFSRQCTLHEFARPSP